MVISPGYQVTARWAWLQGGWGEAERTGPPSPTPSPLPYAHTLSCTRCPWSTHHLLGPVLPPEPQTGRALCLGGRPLSSGERGYRAPQVDRESGEKASPPTPGAPYLIPLSVIEHYSFLENAFLHSFFFPNLKILLFIILFLVALGLHYCTRAFL